MNRQSLRLGLFIAIAPVTLVCLVAFAQSGPQPIDPKKQPTRADGLPADLLAAGETLSVGRVTADPGYSLDHLKREIAPTGRVRCPKVKKVRYKGDVIRYHSPVWVYVDFRDRLRLFEKVVRQTAIDIYGRAPRKIRHIGTYNCRRIGLWPTYLSEHGIANGIDVAGFDFGPLPRRTPRAVRKATPKKLRRAFKVRMIRHWHATSGVAHSHHRRFLRLLAARLVLRRDIFRVLLGPSYPGHKNHFHFDVSPWRLVQL
ncbi:MAG: extensin family protein [Myxococcales bacterium]|nr:extensin family protein [Myxococcales bacterium]